MSLAWALIFLFVAASAVFFVVLYRRRNIRIRQRIKAEPLLTTEVREKTHELKNEATKLRMVTRRISRSDDPIGALVEAMTNGHSKR